MVEYQDDLNKLELLSVEISDLVNTNNFENDMFFPFKFFYIYRYLYQKFKPYKYHNYISFNDYFKLGVLKFLINF